MSLGNPGFEGELTEQFLLINVSTDHIFICLLFISIGWKCTALFCISRCLYPRTTGLDFEKDTSPRTEPLHLESQSETYYITSKEDNI